jgi:hypothetical protein
LKKYPFPEKSRHRFKKNLKSDLRIEEMPLPRICTQIDDLKEYPLLNTIRFEKFHSCKEQQPTLWIIYFEELFPLQTVTFFNVEKV